ncbi:uncharacterized protein LOC110711088 [Chenopodium quinoa]|uniref:DUF241 domain protein n=1 Tax=Chenopodium quinoa TaxID=63459 RepID=A0A803NBF1_CHEQI|nr:uncharacterized protein LOC110711088 [Chenopodium quinoa]
MENLKTSSHTRSLSLPSTSHPLNASIEIQFCKLRAATQARPSSLSICQNLCNIKDLYEQMNDMIHLPNNQQVLSNEHHKKEVERVLEGSLSLLDASSSGLDALSQMKDSILEIESALRRGINDEGIHIFEVSRKKVCKVLSKSLANLKKAEKNCALTQPEGACITVRMLKEAEAISLSILKSLFSFLMGNKAASQTRGWSLVAKLVKSKHVSRDAENITEVVCIDNALSTLSDNHSSDETKVVLRQLELLEKVILDLEDGLESISRCFVRTRVSLLNVYN